MYVLIADPEANDYKTYLESKFPTLSFHSASTEKEILPHAEKMDVLVTVFRASDDVFKRAGKLQWVQALTTGVNYILNRPSLRKDVIVTSCRGIHGPQMSEMALLLMLALNRNFPQVIRNQDQRVWQRWPGR